jgi:hypothetical protein
MSFEETMLKVEEVLALAKVGRIFPAFSVKNGICRCRIGANCTSPGKHPVTYLAPHGLLDATQDQGVILQWLSQQSSTNWGLVAGESWWALDVDPRHGGDVSLAKLEAEHGRLPKTVTSRTGGGGLHLFFRPPMDKRVRNTSNVLGQDYPGLDTRAGGRGYVIAPPSLHQSGRKYEWESGCAPGQVEVAVAPDWLIEAVVEKPRVRRAVELPDLGKITDLDRRRAAGLLEWAATEVATAAEGERNNTLFRMSALVGGWIGAGYLSRSEAESALEDAAEVCGLGWREAERTSGSGLDRGDEDPQPLPDDTDRKREWLIERGLLVAVPMVNELISRRAQGGGH